MPNQKDEEEEEKSCQGLHQQTISINTNFTHRLIMVNITQCDINKDKCFINLFRKVAKFALHAQAIISS